MFIITGIFQGHTVTVKYEDGVLSGDQIVIEKAKEENTKDHGYLGLVPSGSESDYLSYEMSAHSLFTKHIFDQVISSENDWEPFDPEIDY